MTLSALLQAAAVSVMHTAGDADLTSITIDSRRAKPGALFVCMPGMTRDSQEFLADAAANGASAAIVYKQTGFQQAQALNLATVELPPDKFPESIWRLCDAFFDHPTRSMRVIGCTGTNGKTTTASILRDMLTQLGLRAAYLGTLGFELPGEQRELPNTTPFAVDLYNMLAEARDKHVEALAIEVSSHALAQRRIDGVEFDAAVFTNLTQDHLDFHGTMEEYAAAKHRLFTELPRQTGKRFVPALNQDDPTGRTWANELPYPKVRFSTRAPSDVWGTSIDVRIDRIAMLLHFSEEPPVRIEVPLGGHYNLENLIAAFAGMRALGFSLDEVAAASSAIRPVRGRFEDVPNDKGIHVLIDYAHTPDALAKLLTTVRSLSQGHVITVFGCGGDRDRTKRPPMAREASERSNLTIVTSDNPRTEDPQAILDEVLTGIVPDRESLAIVDRPEAIHTAIRLAKPGDTVVIAGKGHEDYQIIGREKFPMDDRALARQALEE